MPKKFLFDYDDLQEFLNLLNDENLRSAAWPKEQFDNACGDFPFPYSEVTSQDEPPEPLKMPTKGLLFALSMSNMEIERISQPRDQRIANLKRYDQVVRNHKIYKRWLETNSHFECAEVTFDRFVTQTDKVLAGSEFVKLRFLRMVAEKLGTCLLGEHYGMKINRANKRQLLQAKALAEKLKYSFKEGVRIKDFVSQHELSRLLDLLCREIDAAPRKSKAGPNSTQRHFIHMLGRDLLRTFDTLPPKLLEELAGVVNWFPDATTIQRLVAKVKEERAKEMANQENQLAIKRITQAFIAKPHKTAKI